jgi:hypothetical protein
MASGPIPGIPQQVHKTRVVGPKRHKGRLQLATGIIFVVLGWIALAIVDNYAPDTAGSLGEHKVLQNYGALHTLSIGVIICGLVIAAFAVWRLSRTAVA